MLFASAHSEVLGKHYAKFKIEVKGLSYARNLRLSNLFNGMSDDCFPF